MNRRPRVLFHLTQTAAVDPGCDAVLQEVALLDARLAEGETVAIAPRRPLTAALPRRWWGLHRLLTLRRLEARFDLHQVYNPDLFGFPYLRHLRRPIVYSAVSGLAGDLPAIAGDLARRLHVVVPTESDRRLVRASGCASATVIRPGVDLTALSPSEPAPDRPFTLLMGSAPWTREQFVSKGVEALLEVASTAPDLRWVLLWRGVLADEIERQVGRHGVADRVTVHHRRVAVDQILTEVHAGVLLATHAALVKAYPQSLLECLAAARPVVVSRPVAISDWVREHQCGEVVDQVTAPALAAAIERLRAAYSGYRQRARASVARDFSLATFLEAYGRLYRALTWGSADPAESGT